MPTIEQQTAQIEPEVTTLAVKAQDLIITTSNDAQWASDFLSEIKAMKAQVSETFDPICATAHTAWKEAVAGRDRHLRPLDAATCMVKDKLGAWKFEQYRTARLELEARQRAAEAVEKARREEEARVVAEAIKAQREAAAAAKRAGGDALAQRMREEANEQAALQRELDAQPIVAVVEAAPPPQKIAGVSTRQDFDFVIENPLLVPRDYCTPDEKMIRGVVRATKGKIVIPGVKIVSKPVVSVR